MAVGPEQQRSGGLLAAGTTPESQPNNFLLENFGTLNTKAKRTAIEDEEFAWIENLIPLGAGNLRSLYDAGDVLYTTSNPRTIVGRYAYNIGATEYFVVFLDDGTAVQVKKSDGSTTTISSTADTFRCSTGNSPGCAQWGSKYLLIVVDDSTLGSSNGYFIWDGSVLFKAGTLQPQVTITNAGSGYTSAPTVAATGGSGTGSTFTATVTNGSVTQIKVTNPGSGYLVGESVTLGFTGGGGSGAAATVNIFPFGISGTCIEVFTGRVWVFNGATGTFGAPNNVGNFSTSAGGGSFLASDSFLRNRVNALHQSNGFLYYFGDSSVNVISNVQTSGSPATTTFSNQNVDPQVGTEWRDCVQPFGRALVYANPSGVYALYGGAAEKVSPQLDGLFAIADFTNFTPSASVMTIFGVKVYMLMISAHDPTDTTYRNMLCLWDGQKWFIASQSKNADYCILQELNSNVTAWGTDSTRLFPLFTSPSNDIMKWFQSKLWKGSGLTVIKEAQAAYLQVFNNDTGDTLDLTMEIDTDMSASEVVMLGSAGVINFTNNSGGLIQFQNSSLQDIFFVVTGYVINAGSATTRGHVMGMTCSATTKDFTLVSAIIMYNDQTVDGP